MIRSGPDNGLAVLVHIGTPNGLVALPPPLAEAYEGLRNVLYARPGFDSSTRQQGRTIADAVSDASAILDALGVEEFVTIGWSAGGPHGLVCSALLTERCLTTAVFAAPAPFTEAVELRDWYENDEDNRLALAGDLDGVKKHCDELAAQHAHVQALDLAGWFTGEADNAALSGDYGEWLAATIRSAYAPGGAGSCDDHIAISGHWGFDLGDARGVAVWHGDVDEIVPPAHGRWLSARLPGATLHVLEGEGHISIGLRMAEIVDDLLLRAGRSRSATVV